MFSAPVAHCSLLSFQQNILLLSYKDHSSVGSCVYSAVTAASVNLQGLFLIRDFLILQPTPQILFSAKNIYDT